jgi:NADPH:quinone reductase-like Zn-dependent oxidoreductase
MKAALFHEHGDPSVLRIAEVALPEPGPGAVRLRVRAVALNHLDLWVRRGLPVEIPLPHIGGADVAGVVDGVGPGVEGWEPGTAVVADPSLSCGECAACERGEEPLCAHYRILGEHVAGGLAEYVVVPARNLYRIPDSWPMERAAAAPLVFLTAWRGLVSRGRLRAGESVLVTGASGGVATAAVQIARRAGARVFAVTTAGHAERVRALGADVVYDREAGDFSQALRSDTERRGVDLVFDSVGAALWPQCMRALGRGGRLVVYGATTGPHVEMDLRHVFWKQLEVIGTTMSNRREFREVMDVVFGGGLEPVVDVVWPLERVVEAHERLERGDAFGKVVLTP